MKQVGVIPPRPALDPSPHVQVLCDCHDCADLAVRPTAAAHRLQARPSPPPLPPPLTLSPSLHIQVLSNGHDRAELAVRPTAAVRPLQARPFPPPQSPPSPLTYSPPHIQILCDRHDCADLVIRQLPRAARKRLADGVLEHGAACGAAHACDRVGWQAQHRHDALDRGRILRAQCTLCRERLHLAGKQRLVQRVRRRLRHARPRAQHGKRLGR
eukprot:361930-Chlamydomonas_euryale.AAC.1